MKWNPNEKGKELEDLVEYYLKLMGMKYRRNVRVRGLSGALHEIDFLVFLNNQSKEVIEVKNLEKPVSKDVIMKVAEIVEDIGAYRGVVVSASGFTLGAIKMAKRLGVILFDQEDIEKSINILRRPLNVTKIVPSYDLKTALKFSRRFLKGIFFLKLEKIEGLRCITYPFYDSLGIRRSGNKSNYYSEVKMLFSAYSGLPTALINNKLREVGEEVSSLPPEVLRILGEVQGRKVCRKEVVGLYGEGMWRRLKNVVTSLKLGEIKKEGRAICIKVSKLIPNLDSFKKAYLFYKSSQEFGNSHNKNIKCELIEPRVSPGTVRLISESLLSVVIVNIKMVYLPIYQIKVVPKGTSQGLYRYIYLTAWSKKPIEFIPVDDTIYF